MEVTAYCITKKYFLLFKSTCVCLVDSYFFIYESWQILTPWLPSWHNSQISSIISPSGQIYTEAWPNLNQAKWLKLLMYLQGKDRNYEQVSYTFIPFSDSLTKIGTPTPTALLHDYRCIIMTSKKEHCSKNCWRPQRLDSRSCTHLSLRLLEECNFSKFPLETEFHVSQFSLWFISY